MLPEQATQVILPEPSHVVKGKFQLICNRSVRVDDHEHDERQHEDDRERDGDAIEVLLDDARAGLRGVHRARDHVGDAGALAGMQQDEHDEAQARNDEQDKHDDKERVQDSSLFFRSIHNGTQVAKYSEKHHEEQGDHRLSTVQEVISFGRATITSERNHPERFD